MLKQLLVISVAAAGLAAAQSPNLDVKLGLWEITTVTKGAGMPAMDTSKMPPEARARVEAMMKARGAHAGTPHTTRNCVTKEKLQKNTMFDSDQVRESCKRTVITNTRSVVEMKVECTDEKYPTTAIAHFEMASHESMKGNIKLSGAVNTEIDLTGKWLGESCGDVK